MKIKISLLFFVIFFSLLVGGGIVHNTNQSADFIRTLNRNASTDIDAVYFNPAGLVFQDDGLYVYFSNQTIWQSRTIKTTYPTYNNSEFVGETFVPAFPNIYLVKKTNKLAFSFGFMPIGGGGSADFPKGLPTFDRVLAQYVNFSDDLSGYAMDAAFVGSSIYLGLQTNASYKINDMISAGLGVRYIIANNTYDGTLDGATLITASGIELNNGNRPDLLPPDIVVESERSGTTITPVLSLNIKPMDNILISAKFEPRSTLEMLSKTKEDGTFLLDSVGMFPDDTKYRSDIPSQLAFGLNASFGKILFSSSFNYYLYTDSNLDWGGKEKYTDNGLEVGGSVEYALSDKLACSVGFLHAVSGTQDAYQEDLSYSIDSNTLGTGFKYSLSTASSFSFGVSNTFYVEGQNNKVGTIFEEKYMKTALDISIGYQRSL
ncbi:MAG: hypothetical protein HQ509_00680 [Candidatus Marinimicrobia bacterium]|nr:hypothetical protein [Candidatus Neomarinimicrobiota bacterium]